MKLQIIITSKLNTIMERAMNLEGFNSKAEFIREAIRFYVKDLESRHQKEIQKQLEKELGLSY